MSSTATSASKPRERRTRCERTIDLSASRTRLNELKRDIALDRYDPDPTAVADAILTKLLLVRRGRLALAEGAAGQSRPAAERRPDDL